MKGNKKVLIELLFLLLIPSFSFCEDMVSITSMEWPPYLSQNTENFGFGSKIVSDVFALEGIKVSYGFFPPKRSLYEVNKGKEWRGSILWPRSPAIEKDYYISDAVLGMRLVLFHLKGSSFKWDSIDDLKKYNIGGVLENYYGKELSDAENEGKIRIERVPNPGQNMMKLLFGRIDAFIQDLDVGLAMLKTLKPEERNKITFSPKFLPPDSTHLILSKKNPDNIVLLDRFNTGLEKYKNSGEYARAMRSFFVERVILAANMSVKDDHISADDLKAILLGKTTKWTDGKRIILALIEDEEKTDLFLRQYAGKSYSQFNEYWRQMLFTGKGQLPPFFKNGNDLAEFVSRTEGAIGYFPNEIPADNLKILK